MGWLVKAVIIYLLIAGLLHATEAMRIKKELGFYYSIVHPLSEFIRACG
jgi:hypothetical protein